ncbi:CAAX protease self-immunity [Bifidobacterium margollesii]|uniref:CAAX protease self-immunity n=1 Tax=Bifidobacterium margollesii TaxID=2020964 RepID=A0A2N5J9P6_9BIFI|nr:CPBP family intramembrane glutamic endopeptidase [Bifidobacterium margollesii]PLS30891.1 CAAX protease self-immunity [Bifidobacterium margollesii]
MDDNGMNPVENDGGKAPTNTASTSEASAATTMATDVRQRYPLPPDEQRAITQQLVVCDILLIVAGLLLACVASLIQANIHGQPWHADAMMTQMLAALTPHWIVASLPIALVLWSVLWEAVGRSHSSYLQARQRQRSGIRGEMPRLPFGVMLPLMVLAGVSEELLFRYGLQSLLTQMLSWIVGSESRDGWPGQGAAVVVTALAFWYAHEQCRDFWNAAYVIIIGLILGSTFAITGNLLAIVCAHIVYNIVDVLRDRRAMLREDDYFQGDAPCDVVLRTRREMLLKEQAREGI